MADGAAGAGPGGRAMKRVHGAGRRPRREGAPIGVAFLSFTSAILLVFAAAAVEPQLGVAGLGAPDLADRLGLVGATVFGVAAAVSGHRALAIRSGYLAPIAAVLLAGAAWSWQVATAGPGTGPGATMAAGAVATALAVALLAEGLWRAHWLGVFCGLGAVGVSLVANLDRVGQGAAGSAAAALLLALSAMTCLYGILVEIEAGEQHTRAELVAAKHQIEAEIGRTEELLHDLRSGLLSIEAAMAAVDSELGPPLRAEAARLRRLTVAPDPGPPAEPARSGRDATVAGRTGRAAVVDLAPDLRDLVATRRAAGLAVELRCPGPALAPVDRSEILAVVENLLSNAGRHGRPPVTVAVEPADRPGGLAISVSDRGGPTGRRPRRRLRAGGDQPRRRPRPGPGPVPPPGRGERREPVGGGLARPHPVHPDPAGRRYGRGGGGIVSGLVAPAPAPAPPAAGTTPDVVLIDDHPLLAFGLARQLEAGGRRVEIADVTAGRTAGDAAGDAADRDRLLAAVIGRRPSLVVLDLGLPVDGGGLALVEPLVAAGPTVAVLTGEADRLLWARCAAAGAAVVLSKAEPLDDLTLAIDRLLRGDVVRPHQRPELDALLRAAEAERARALAGFDQLSHRERQVLAGLLAGHGPSQLADRHGVSVETARSQTKSVLRKLGVSSQLEAVARAVAAGWTAG